MTQVTVYTKPWCPYCGRATNLLNHKNIAFKEIDVSSDSRRESEMRELSQAHTVPQIFIGDTHLGGSDDLLAAEKSGLLESLLLKTAEQEATL